MIALGNISLQAGDMQRARNAFVKASELDFDHALKADGLFNYTKILFEQDSSEAALGMALEYLRENATIAHDTEKKETPETLLTEILSGTSNLEAAINFIEAFCNREREPDLISQKVASYRGLELQTDKR